MKIIDRWINGYKVEASPWIDGKRIHFCVQYYEPGQSIERAPAWEKTVYITDNEGGRKLLTLWVTSFVEYVARMHVEKGTEVTITA